MWFRKETATDAGDGLLKLWIDGILVISYDGEDQNDPYFGAVCTRNTPVVRLEFAGILNTGSPIAQQEWFDNVQVWIRPD